MSNEVDCTGKTIEEEKYIYGVESEVIRDQDGEAIGEIELGWKAIADRCQEKKEMNGTVQQCQLVLGHPFDHSF